MLKVFSCFLIQSFLILQVCCSFDEISTKCKNQYICFESALNNRRDWALELFDKWGKLQFGVLDGNVHNFGDYDGCLRSKHVSALTDVGTIIGKYCLIAYTAYETDDDSFSMNFIWAKLGILANNKEITMSSGICIPESCSLKDVEKLSTHIFSQFKLNMTLVTCEPNHPISFQMRSLAIVIFVIVLLAVIFSTIYELYMSQKEKTPCGALITFSVIFNGRNLFDLKKSESKSSIQCLNGLRAVSLLWIIFGHRYFEMFLAPAVNRVSATEDWLKNILSLSHTTFHLAVDTFFLMGGLLTTWSFMKTFDANNFNVFKIYFHRFLRYTPLLVFLLLFFISFSPYLGSGPIFDLTLKNWLPNCYHFWWSSILHVATYTNIDNLCLNWTWYLSADFQLFVLSPVLVYPAWRWRWKFFGVFPVLILFSVIYIFIISMFYEFLVFVGPLQSKGQYDYDRLLYYPTHARCGPWLVGMTLGFIMYQNRERKQQVNQVLSRFLWIFAISSCLAIIFGYFPFQQKANYPEIPNIVNATYNALFRSYWAMAIAWMIFACHNGNGGFVRRFLCFPYFQPLARMSLSIYLTHRVYQILTVASIKQPIHLDPFDLMHVYFGDILWAVIIGILVYLFFEAPFANIEARLLKK